MGAGALLIWLLGTAVVHLVLTGFATESGKVDLVCLFVPFLHDIEIHLISYVIVGTVLIGIASTLMFGPGQRFKMRLLGRNLALLHATDTGLGPLVSRLGLKDKVHLLDSEVTLCFCSGFISPHIYLSRDLVEKLTPNELEAILLHEKYHLENHDPLKLVLGTVVVSALFFVPVMKDVLKRYLIEKEIAADRRAIRYQGRVSGLAGALEKLVRERSSCKEGAVAVGGEEALSYRIDHLTGCSSQQVHRISLRRLVSSMLVIAFILAIIVAPLPGSLHVVGADIANNVCSSL
jgi:beta-lactamase regulating signal transducer with metallopeptidase domain